MENINLEKQDNIIESSFFEKGEKFWQIRKELPKKGFNFLEHGAILARFGEEGFSGDGSSLFTVVSEGGKNKLLKLAYGEFSHETFSDSPKTYPENALKLQKLPASLFVVNQRDGFFDIEKNLKSVNGDVLKYLEKYANFGFIEGKLHKYKIYGANSKQGEELGSFEIDSVGELINKIKNLE